jgi:DNA-binding transcriptional LysR family regulator
MYMSQTTFLWYLVQIEHYQSLSLAAEQLHVSQPALSKGIKTLEEQLGVKLLTRTYKGVTLTEEGLQVAALAKPIFHSLDQIETLFQSKDTDSHSFLLDDIIIYTNPGFASIIYDALADEYHSHNTKNALQIFSNTSYDEMDRMIRNNKNVVVLGIVDENNACNNEYDRIRILSKSKAYIQCSKQFPYFSAEQTSVSLRELVNVPLVLPQKRLEFINVLLAQLQQYGEPCVNAIALDSASIHSMISNNIAAGFINKFFKSPELDEHRILPIRNTPIFNLILMHHPNADPQKINKLCDLIQQQLL